MGVIGLPRSVEGVSEAIEELHLAKIPMVSSTATADRFGYIARPRRGKDRPGEPSPYYFHVGPTNFRMAALGARFARQRLLAGVRQAVGGHRPRTARPATSTPATWPTTSRRR